MSTEYLEVFYPCDDGVGISIHVEYELASGKVLAMHPFWVKDLDEVPLHPSRHDMSLRERFEKYRDGIELAVFEAIENLRGDEVKTVPWIPRTVRLPRSHEVDPYNQVIAWDSTQQRAVCVEPHILQMFETLTHWKPTRLPREFPPSDQNDAVAA